MNKPRLIQILKRSGLVNTREECMEIIKSGRVCVDGEPVYDIYYQSRPHRVTIDGKPIKLVEEMVYYIMNKPSGYSCQKTDEKNVLDLIKIKDKQIKNMLFTVGRLDVDTSGLVIITNDGSILHKILKPEFDVWKTYEATVDKTIYPEKLEKFRKGLIIEVDGDPYKTLPARIEKKGQFEYTIQIQEGKKRQVRKMLEMVDVTCLKLHRQKIGGLELPKGLKEGQYVEVKKDELRKIFKR
ncbi:rRNA pseudouridine synthase [Candidatus Woesearchaeota archaeon]|nr:rRNA pseudouridine synthase [Candidatus Woesearchaeota archaeon]